MAGSNSKKREARKNQPPPPSRPPPPPLGAGPTQHRERAGSRNDIWDVQGETYPMTALLKYSGDESVQPLIKAKTHQQAATAALIRGDHDQAMMELSAAFKLAEHVLAFTPKGLRAMIGGADEVLRVDPGHVDARFCRSQLRLLVGGSSPARVVHELDAIILQQPGEPEFYRVRGCMKAFDQQFRSAAQDFSEAIRLQGGPQRCDPDMLYLRGSSLAIKGDFTSLDEVHRCDEDLLEFLRRASPRNRKVPNACYFLAASPLAAMAVAKKKGRINDERLQEMQAMQAWYAKGQEAERKMLPFYPPVASPQRDIVAFMLTTLGTFQR